MANISIGGRLSLMQQVASLDLRYGPYSSIDDAFESMGPNGDDVITSGLLFGVTEDDDNVSLYIWTKTNDATINDCKKINKDFVVLFNGFVDISMPIEQQSYNDIGTKDDIVFLNSRKQFAYRDGLRFYINWKNRYIWSNVNYIPHNDVIYIDINSNKTYYFNGITLIELSSDVVKFVNDKSPDSSGNINISKEDIGLENVDNTADENKVVKGANEDGSGNNISTTYETKADATAKQTALQEAIANLTGLDSNNFGGFSIQSTEADAISNITTLYTADGYTDELLWYMAGTNLSSVKAYRYNGSGTPTLISSDTYDCVDFSGLIADVSTLRQDLTALGHKLGEPQVIPITDTGKYINLSGEIGSTVSLTPGSSSSGYAYCLLSVSEGDTLIVNGVGANSARLWGFIDEDNKLLSVAESNVTATNLRLTVPSGAVKAIIHDNSGSTSYIIHSGKVVVRVDDIVNDLTTGGTNVPASAETVKNLGQEIYRDKEEKITYSQYPGNNYNPGSSTWFRGNGSHVAVPVSDLGGTGAKIKLTASPYGYACFVTSYTAPTSASAIPFADAAEVTNNGGTSMKSGRLTIMEGNTWYIVIPNNASHLILSTKDSGGTAANFNLYTITTISVYDKVVDIEQEIVDFDTRITELEDSRTLSGGVSYNGEKISLKRPKVRITRLCKTPRCQGMWYRNGYFFSCELITNSRFELYHYENNSLVLKAYWDIQSTVGHTYSEGVHANSMQPTTIYYDQNDEFPLFTVGGNLNSQSGIMYVMRLYKDGNDTWQLTKLYEVQDNEHRFGLIAFEDGTIGYVGTKVFVYNKGITAENTETIIVSDEDIVKRYDNFAQASENSMYQDTLCYGNRIYHLKGDNHSMSGGVLTEPGRLMIFDLITEKRVNDIQLIPLGIVAEPEGIDIDDEVMYIAENGENNNGYLWKLEFD